MTLPIYKSSEPLYIIISRDPEVKTRFTKWSTTSRSIQAKIEDNRLLIYDQNTLCYFMTTWSGGWDSLVVWDTYLKRHLHL